MTKKKSSFGRFIFILIILLIVIFGGYFGYQYYSEGKGNSVSTIKPDGEIKFPIAGTWYVNDSGEAYQDNALNFSEYTFETPAKVDGKLTGKINVVSNNDGNPVRTGSYEIAGDNKLIISFPNEMDYEFTYTHYPDEQKLEMNFAGQNRTLTRTNPVAQNATPEKEAVPETEEEKQTRLFMEKIEGEWKSQYGTLVRFNKPVKEGNIITAELEIKSTDGNKLVYTYKRSADGELNGKGVKVIHPDGTENPSNSELRWKMRLNDDGDTLTFGGRTHIRVN